MHSSLHPSSCTTFHFFSVSIAFHSRGMRKIARDKEMIELMDLISNLEEECIGRWTNSKEICTVL